LPRDRRPHARPADHAGQAARPAPGTLRRRRVDRVAAVPGAARVVGVVRVAGRRVGVGPVGLAAGDEVVVVGRVAAADPEAEPVLAGGDGDGAGEGEVDPAGGLPCGDRHLRGDRDQRAGAAGAVGVEHEPKRRRVAAAPQVRRQLRHADAARDRVRAARVEEVRAAAARQAADRRLAEGGAAAAAACLDDGGLVAGGGGGAVLVAGGDLGADGGADVVAGEGVAGAGGAGDGGAVVAGGVAALPLVAEAGGGAGPAAVAGGECLSLLRLAGVGRERGGGGGGASRL